MSIVKVPRDNVRARTKLWVKRDYLRRPHNHLLARELFVQGFVSKERYLRVRNHGEQVSFVRNAGTRG